MTVHLIIWFIRDFFSSSHGYVCIYIYVYVFTNELYWNEIADYTLQYPLHFAHVCTRYSVCGCHFRRPNFR